MAVSPWNESRYTYAVGQLLIGNNPISKIEVVSALNSFNLARYMYEYHAPTRTEKYNPKVYLGAVQGVAGYWISDENSGLTSGQKSGSWPF